MPLGDRFWWLRMLGALLVLIAASAFTLFQWQLAVRTGLDHTLIWLIAGMGALYTLILAIGAWRARQRKRARLAAIRGDQSAIPELRLLPQPAFEPDLTQGPLELRWRDSKSVTLQKPTTRANWIAATISLVGILAFPLAMWLAIRHSMPKVSLFDVLPPTLLGIGIGGGSILILLIILPSVWGIITKQALPFSRKRDFSSVTATADSITWQPPSGRPHTIRWKDARLLEFCPNRCADAFAYEYILYSERDAVKWQVHLLTAVTSLFIDSVSQDDTQRQQALLALVQAQTGLVPRTFVRPFQHAPDLAGQRALRTTSMWLAAASLMLSALAAAVMAFPIVTIVWWNALIVGALAVATLLCLIVWRRVRRLRAWETSDSTPSTIELDATSLPPSDLYLLDTMYSKTGKVLGLAIMATMGLADLLAFGATIANFAGLMTPSSSVISPDASFPLALVVALAGFVGVLAGFSSVAVSRSNIQADAQGLSQQVRTYRVQARWSEITELHVYRRAGKVVLYGVRRAPGEPVISWSRAQVRPRLVPSGASIISPDQLAALVASRTGAPVLLHELPR